MRGDIARITSATCTPCGPGEANPNRSIPNGLHQLVGERKKTVRPATLAEDQQR